MTIGKILPEDVFDTAGFFRSLRFFRVEKQARHFLTDLIDFKERSMVSGRIPCESAQYVRRPRFQWLAKERKNSFGGERGKIQRRECAFRMSVKSNRGKRGKSKDISHAEKSFTGIEILRFSEGGSSGCFSFLNFFSAEERKTIHGQRNIDTYAQKKRWASVPTSGRMIRDGSYDLL